MRLLRVNPFSPPRRAHESRQRKSRNVHSVARYGESSGDRAIPLHEREN
jgi:hypothetical protein